MTCTVALLWTVSSSDRRMAAVEPCLKSWPWMNKDAFEAESFDAKEYIKKRMKNSTYQDINSAIQLLQKSILLNKSQSGALVKEHFSKFVECNTVLEQIMRDVKHKQLSNEYIRHKCGTIASKLSQIADIKDSETRKDSESIKRRLQSNYTNFAEFVRIYKEAEDKSALQDEKIVFLNFLTEKIESERRSVGKVAKYFEMYFEVEHDKHKDVRVRNTILVSFKYHLSLVQLINSDFSLFIGTLCQVAACFFKFMGDEKTKQNASEDVFKKIFEQLDVYRRRVGVHRRTQDVDFCDCLDIRREHRKACSAPEVPKNGAARLLIASKVFLRKIGELTKLLSRHLTVDSMRSILYRVEKTKDVWIDIVFSRLNAMECDAFYREIKEVLGSRKEVLNMHMVSHFYVVLDSMHACSVRKYEVIWRAMSDIEDSEGVKISPDALRGMYFALGKNQTIDILSEFQRKMLARISKKIFENCRDDVSCLMVSARIAARAPLSWKRILKYSKSAFKDHHLACFILKDALDASSEECRVPRGADSSTTRSLVSFYSFFRDA